MGRSRRKRFFGPELRSNVYGIRFRTATTSIPAITKPTSEKHPDPGHHHIPANPLAHRGRMKKKITTQTWWPPSKPLTNPGWIDLDCYDELVTEQMRNGVEGLIVAEPPERAIWWLGGTPDAHRPQCQPLRRWTRDRRQYRQQQHPWSPESHPVRFCLRYRCLLQINPYYGKTSDKGLREHFNRVLDLGPAIIYNVLPEPVRTSNRTHRIPGGTLQLVGVKNVPKTKEWVTTNRGIACWSSDDQCFEGRPKINPMEVSVIANLLGLMRKLMDEDNSNDKAAADGVAFSCTES